MCLIIGGILLIGTALNGVIDGFSVINIIYIVMSFVVLAIEFIITKKPDLLSKVAAGKKVLKLAPIVLFLILIIMLSFIMPKPEPFNTALQINKGVANIQAGDFKGAEKKFTKLYNKDSTNPLVNKNLAVINLKAHKTDLTRKYLDAAISDLSFDEGIYYNYGMLYYQMEDFTNALINFEKAIEQNPQMINAHIYAGTMSFRLGNMRRSIYHLENAKFLNPQMPEILFHLGRSHTGMMEYTSAQQDFKEALALKPQPNLKAAIEEQLANVDALVKGVK